MPLPFSVSCKYDIKTFLVFYFLATPSQCRAFAKALHYKEMEFEGARSKKMDANPVAVVEALIHINNQLHQHEVNLKNRVFMFANFDIFAVL